MKKLANSTLAAYQRLTPERKEKVDTIVRAHVLACMRTGCPVDNLDRVCVEAMEIVAMEEGQPPANSDAISYEPRRAYTQYQSPLREQLS